MTMHPLSERALRWFGQSWGEPINAECAQQKVPVGWLCLRCNQRVLPTDSGLTLRYLALPCATLRYLGPEVQRQEGATQRVAYHVDCFMRATTGQWPAFAPHARFCPDGQTTSASAGATRRVRGFAPARSQRN